MPLLRTLLALLLLTLLITCGTTRLALAQTASSAPCNPVGYGPAQDQLIATSLRKYEVLKPLAHQLRLRGDSLFAANQGLHRVIVYQSIARAQSNRQGLIQDKLYQDADTKAQVWHAKAKARWWLNVGLGAVALLLGAAAVR